MAGIYQLGYAGKAADGSTCCGGSTTPPVKGSPGCPCTATGIPATLNVAISYGTATPCVNPQWQPTTLVYGRHNPYDQPGDPAPAAWVSPVYSGTDCQGNTASYFAFVVCNQYALVYSSYIYEGGQWVPYYSYANGYPSSCSPFMCVFGPNSGQPPDGFVEDGGKIIVTG